jgi:hypothetical protein
MAGIDIFANYMAELDEAADPGTIRSTLEKLQTLLASAEASHDRIVYLETLGKQVPEYRGDATPVADPLTASQRAACVEKGLIGAWEAGDVEAGDLAKLGHSVEGLGHFTDVLFKTPEDRRHRACQVDSFRTDLRLDRVHETCQTAAVVRLSRREHKEISAGSLSVPVARRDLVSID